MSHEEILSRLEDIQAAVGAGQGGSSEFPDVTRLISYPDNGSRAKVPNERLIVDFEEGTVESTESSFSDTFRGFQDSPQFDRVRSFVFFSTLDGGIALDQEGNTSFIDQCNWHKYEFLRLSNHKVVFDFGQHSGGIEPSQTVEFNLIASNSPIAIYTPVVQTIHANNQKNGINVNTSSFTKEVTQHIASFREHTIMVSNTGSNSLDMRVRTAQLNDFIALPDHPITVAAGDTQRVTVTDPIHAYHVDLRETTGGSSTTADVEWMSRG